MLTLLQADVNRWGHNRELVSVQMTKGEPHVLKFIGDAGQPQYGDDIREMLDLLMERGYEFRVYTVFTEVPLTDIGGD